MSAAATTGSPAFSQLWRLAVTDPTGRPATVELRAPSEGLVVARFTHDKPGWVIRAISRRPTNGG